MSVSSKKEMMRQQEKERMDFERRLKKIGKGSERKISIDILRGKF